jgi:flavin reductase (DIM6/NTAB) family NADH-FMN oxidoreductase RutF
VPLLTDALAALECEIVAEHAAGDHWIVVGRVDGLRTRAVGRPLIFFAGAFRKRARDSEEVRCAVGDINVLCHGPEKPCIASVFRYYST